SNRLSLTVQAVALFAVTNVIEPKRKRLLYRLSVKGLEESCCPQLRLGRSNRLFVQVMTLFATGLSLNPEKMPRSCEWEIINGAEPATSKVRRLSESAISETSVNVRRV